MRRWQLGRKCRVCGARSLWACGARAAERNVFPDGGFFAWRKWSPCTELMPGGLRGGPLLDDAGDLDDVRGIEASFAWRSGVEVR